MSDKLWAQTYHDIMLHLDTERNMMVSALREVAQEVFNAIEKGRE